MNTRKPKSSDIILTPVPCAPTNNMVMEMVKEAEKRMEKNLDGKRDRLMNKFDHEIYHYYDEIQRKRTALCEEEFNLRRQNLDRMRIDCETERQKFIELKRLQQHMQNSDEIRLEASRKLRQACERTIKEQIEEKQKHEMMVRAAEEMRREEMWRKQKEEDWKKDQEAERIRLQRKLEIKQDLQKQLGKNQSAEKRNEIEMERKLLEEQNKILKNQMEEIGKEKQREIQSHMEFLRHQIQQRKREETLHQQRDIEYGKTMAEMAQQKLRQEAAEIEQAKKLRHIENQQYLDYLERVRAEKREIEAVEFDPRQVSLITEELDDDSRRNDERRLLREEKRNQYFRELKEKHLEKMKEKEQDYCTFAEQQKQNAEYEKMMAKKKAQHKAQIQQDLEHQIQEQNMEMAKKREEEIKCNKKIEEIQRATSDLTQRILSDDIKDVKSLFKSHPFQHCLQSNCSNGHY